MAQLLVEPFVFEFEVPVHAVRVNQKAKVRGVTLRLDRVIYSPGRPRADICYEPRTTSTLGLSMAARVCFKMAGAHVAGPGRGHRRVDAVELDGLQNGRGGPYRGKMRGVVSQSRESRW